MPVSVVVVSGHFEEVNVFVNLIPTVSPYKRGSISHVQRTVVRVASQRACHTVAVNLLRSQSTVIWCMASGMSFTQDGLRDIIESHDNPGCGISIENPSAVCAEVWDSVDDIVLDIEIIGAPESRWEGPFEVPHPIPRALSPVVEVESVGAREIQNAMIHHTKDPATKANHMGVRG